MTPRTITSTEDKSLVLPRVYFTWVQRRLQLPAPSSPRLTLESEKSYSQRDNELQDLKEFSRKVTFILKPLFVLGA